MGCAVSEPIRPYYPDGEPTGEDYPEQVREAALAEIRKARKLVVARGPARPEWPLADRPFLSEGTRQELAAAGRALASGLGTQLLWERHDNGAVTVTCTRSGVLVWAGAL